MPLTTLDPKTALVVIDLQKGIVGLTTVHPLDEIVARTVSLVIAWRWRDLPVVLVNVAGRSPGRTDAGQAAPTGYTPPPDWMDLIADLQPQPEDHRITKATWGAFHGSSLNAILRDQGVTQIVLAGVATSIGVESTARSAYEHGYHVVLAIDAMTDVDAGAHQNSIERIFPKLGETATTDEIIKKLEKAR
jgi:nicotinamidase-related amidase